MRAAIRYINALLILARREQAIRKLTRKLERCTGRHISREEALAAHERWHTPRTESRIH